MKVCSKCGETDPDKFYPSRRTVCKACHLAQGNEYRRSEAGQVYLTKVNLAKYGLTQLDYDLLLAAQDGGCAVCGKKPEDNQGRGTAYGKPIALAVDHDHDTNKVRGLLCLTCNLALGYMRDNADLLRRMAQYVEGELIPAEIMAYLEREMV